MQKSSKVIVVHLLLSCLSIQSMYSLGIPHFCMLWKSCLMSMLGKAPLMSRNRVEVTWPFCQAFFTVFISMCRKSVVVCPGLVPKWFVGNRLCFLYIVTMSSIWQVLSSLAMLLDSMIGHQAAGDV